MNSQRAIGKLRRQRRQLLGDNHGAPRGEIERLISAALLDGRLHDRPITINRKPNDDNSGRIGVLVPRAADALDHLVDVFRTAKIAHVERRARTGAPPVEAQTLVPRAPVSATALPLMTSARASAFVRARRRAPA